MEINIKITGCGTTEEIAWELEHASHLIKVHKDNLFSTQPLYEGEAIRVTVTEKK